MSGQTLTLEDTCRMVAQDLDKLAKRLEYKGRSGPDYIRKKHAAYWAMRLAGELRAAISQEEKVAQ